MPAGKRWAWRIDLAHLRHGRHGRRKVGMVAGGDGAEHGRAEQHRLGRGLRVDHLAGRVGNELPHQWALSSTAADGDRVNPDAAGAHRLKDLPGTVAEAAEPGEIERDEAACSVVVMVQAEVPKT